MLIRSRGLISLVVAADTEVDQELFAPGPGPHAPVNIASGQLLLLG